MEKTKEWDEERAKRFTRPVARAAKSVHVMLARRITADWAPNDEHHVFLDVGTGPGRLLVEVKKLFPRARVIGIDPLEYMLNLARQTAESSQRKSIYKDHIGLRLPRKLEVSCSKLE